MTAAKAKGTDSRKRRRVTKDSAKLSPTERRNPASMRLDQMSAGEGVALMLEEEGSIAGKLLMHKETLTRLIDAACCAWNSGGRLFYVGAGTSGRLGVLDASECPPTFNTPPEMVQGIIAGGERALRSAVEGAEDDAKAGATSMRLAKVSGSDFVVGIAASGTTPYVWGALKEAKKRKAKTALVCFNPTVSIPAKVRPDVLLAVDLGPEVLTGSTRLKAGTATKLVLNVITTLGMVRMGKVVSNLMVDVRASNRKLRDRAVRILQALVPVDAAEARRALIRTKWNVKRAREQLLRRVPA